MERSFKLDETRCCGRCGVFTAQIKLNKPTQSEDPRTEEQRKADAERKKDIEDAYKKAKDSIPEPKPKFDPWKNAR